MKISDTQLLRFYTRVAGKAAVTADLDVLTTHLLTDLLKLVQADSGSILLYASGENRLHLFRSVPHPGPATPRSLPVDEGISGQVFRTGRPLRVENIAAATDRLALRRDDRHGSFLSLPLKVARRTIGVLNLNRSAERPGFTRAEESVIVPIAGQITGIVEKARLLDELNRGKQEMEAMFDLVQILYSGGEIRSILPPFLERLEKRLALSRTAILRFRVTGRELGDYEILAARNLSPVALRKMIAGVQQQTSEGIVANDDSDEITLRYRDNGKSMDFFCFPLPIPHTPLTRHFFVVSAPATPEDPEKSARRHRFLEMTARQIRVALERQEMLDRIKSDQEMLMDNALQSKCYLEISKELASTLDPHNVLQKSFEQFGRLIPFSSIAILLFDELENDYQIIFQPACPVTPGYIEAVRQDIVKTVQDYPMDPPVDPKGKIRLEKYSPQIPQLPKRSRFKQASRIPIILGEKGLGLIHLVSRDDKPISAKDLDITYQFTGIFLTSIRNAIIHRRTEKLAYTDPLTGLFNHRYFQENLRSELVRALRYTSPLSLLMIDIDFFKKFNDNYGHQVGDQVLIQVSRVFERSVRENDVVARYGGEEFAAILPATDLDGAFRLAERIRQRVEENLVRTARGNLGVTLSIGLACTQSQVYKKPSDLIEAADTALYQAKDGGRNQVRIFGHDGKK
jgi:diguanylate cyclase (GGDEF)-like protein